MQIDNVIIAAVVGGVVSILTILITWLTQRGKLRAESRSVIEEVNDLIFKRWRIELETYEKRVAKLEKEVESERTKATKHKNVMQATIQGQMSYHENLAKQLKQYKADLESEREKRQRLDRRLEQLKIKVEKLEKENQELLERNKQLARRLGTGEFDNG